MLGGGYAAALPVLGFSFLTFVVTVEQDIVEFAAFEQYLQTNPPILLWIRSLATLTQQVRAGDGSAVFGVLADLVWFAFVVCDPRSSLHSFLCQSPT